MITLITPTRNRPTDFANLEHYMRRQTLIWDRWIVVKDSDVPYTFTCGQEVIHRSPGVPPGQHSVCLNYLEAIKVAGDSDQLFFVEDDDWYQKSYLAVLGLMLTHYDVAGLAPAIYYNTKNRAVARWWNNTWASLSCTAITRKALSIFEEGCRLGNPYIDLTLWNSPKVSKLLFPNSEEWPLHVGLKDGTGVGLGHRLTAPKDPDGSILRQLIGIDADRYLTLA